MSYKFHIIFCDVIAEVPHNDKRGHSYFFDQYLLTFKTPKYIQTTSTIFIMNCMYPVSQSLIEYSHIHSVWIEHLELASHWDNLWYNNNFNFFTLLRNGV